LAEDGETHRPEREPLLSPAELRRRWEAEWAGMDAFLVSIDEAWLARDDEGVPFAGMLLHLANHDTQHRSEAAVLLTQAGRSPGELDLITWLEERAGWRDGVPPSQQTPAPDR
ncbi:MAG TPA: DinB family protein, partial [Candidatus Limnocylindrales bacterium]